MKKEEHLTMVPIRLLRPHPDNPRKDLGDLSELSASIEENGIMQNLTAVREDDGTFTVLIGHRRLAAAKMAGISEVPVRIVEDIDLKDQIAIMLEENMQRSDLTVIEQADSFQMMLDLGDSVNDIVRKTGFSKPTVKHRIELAKLDKELVAEAVYDYSMTLSDLAELEKIEDVEARNEILARSKQKWQIVNAVANYQRKKKCEAALDRLLPLIDKAGIEKDERYHSWSSGYTTIKRYDLDDLPDEIEIPQGEELRWNYPDEWGGCVYIFKKDPEKDYTEEKKREEEERKNIQRIDEIHERFSENLGSFILKIIDGTFKIAKSKEAEVWSGLWPGIKEGTRIYISSDYLESFFANVGTGPKPVSELIEAMIYVYCCYAGRHCLTRDYGGYFNKARAAEIVEILEVFEDLGFVQDDPEIDQMLDGSLSYYKKGE